jgi:ammonium transporter, Amt family
VGERHRQHFLAPGRCVILSAIACAVLLLLGDAVARASKFDHTPVDALTYNLNQAWVLFAGFLVMFMQLGFALLETGFTRAKNAVNTMAMNLIVYPVGLIGFWLTGYAFMMGGIRQWPSLGAFGLLHRELSLGFGHHVFGLIGFGKFGLTGVNNDPGSLAMFLFASVFMGIAATIPTGAMAERWKFSAFLIYGFFMSMLLYPLYGNWVWGGGWLSQLGVNFGLGHGQVDFGGSSVVNMTGGLTGLAGAMVLGPRIGKFRRDGTIGLLAGHNLPLAMGGTLILAFGWFGLNAGSTLAASDTRIGLIAVNTMLASAAGSLTAIFYLQQRYNRPDVATACHGLLGGLVAISASCAFVSPAAAVLIGIIAGFLVVATELALERRFRIDDPAGAIPVHGVCGLWGALAVGIFADGSYGDGWNGVSGPVRGLVGGDVGQFIAQLIGVSVNAIVIFSLAMAFFVIIERTMGNRVSAEIEWTGLDSLEMGSEAYPNV